MQTVGKPERTKTILSESGLYGIVATNIRKQFIEGETQVAGASSALAQDSISKTLTDARIQGYIESGIDNTYSWLNGETANPEIKIDVTSIKADFANNMTQNIEARLATLPACSRNTVPTTSDITAIECIPRGYNTTAEIERIRQQILAADTSDLTGNNEAEQTISLTGDQASNNEAPVEHSLESVKSVYTWAKRIPQISGVLFVVSALAITLLSRPRYKALRTLGLAAIPYGILYLLVGILAPPILANIFKSMTAQSQSDSFAQPLQHIGQSLAGTVGSYFVWFGIALTISGIACFVIYKVIQKRDPRYSSRPISSTPRRI